MKITDGPSSPPSRGTRGNRRYCREDALREPNRPSVGSLKAFSSQRGSQPDSSPPQISSFKDSVLWVPFTSRRSSSPVCRSLCQSHTSSPLYSFDGFLPPCLIFLCPCEPYLRRILKFLLLAVMSVWS